MALTLKEKAYEQIKKFILEGDLIPGDYLTERALEERLSMSRTPIRSALERLEGDGLVNYTPNKGLIVAEISIQRAVDFYDLRIALETYVVRKLSTRSWDEHEIAWFRDNLELQRKFVEKKDNAGFTRADSAFHLQLAKVNDNSEITQAMENLQDKLFRIANRVLRKDSARITASHGDHCRIFELILEGNSEDAVKAMTDHLEFGKRILVL